MSALRLLLAALTLALGVWYGRVKAAKLKSRAQALSALLEFSRHLEVQIRVGGFALPDALRECASRFHGVWTGGYAQALCDAYGDRQSARGLWLRCLDALQDETAAALDKEDRSLLAAFGDQLAGHDLRAIGENFQYLQQRLAARIEEAEQQSKTKGKLYRTVASLAGLACAIVIA